MYARTTGYAPTNEQKPILRRLRAGLIALAILAGVAAGLMACRAPASPIEQPTSDSEIHAPTSIARPPTPTPTPFALSLTVVHTNDTWGYLLPCG